MAKIIGLTGLAGVGKDTFARAMQRRFITLGRKARLGGFADTIREISLQVRLNPYKRETKEVRRLMVWSVFIDALFDAIENTLGNLVDDNDRAMLWTYTVEALEPRMFDDAGTSYISISPREFMQILGTEGGQRVRKTLWVDIALAEWRAAPGAVIVTDFRFAHEAKVLDYAICINRPDVRRVNGHASEDMADMLTRRIVPDYLNKVAVSFVQNTGTQEELETQAAQCANTLERVL
ncbi:hypothetical protein ACJBUE_20880 (plasmid) [Ralstonia syzygii subsp. celebesensis]|uniref:Deoxynucleoside monophosphate kinase n=1 Tax=blood disease bacterium R229 TaxID=741978 RepID=G2ZVZ4_9RALS|nr:hypothetical protein [Ralstonia syzygii]QQV57849.1 hypothetical protein JK151_20720 [Ralstonia syzygii subsp. celebesensis]CCA83275.1 hypothetical protein BDB_mp60441 [blood disease bacterium R229]